MICRKKKVMVTSEEVVSFHIMTYPSPISLVALLAQ